MVSNCHRNFLSKCASHLTINFATIKKPQSKLIDCGTTYRVTTRCLCAAHASTPQHQSLIAEIQLRIGAAITGASGHCLRSYLMTTHIINHSKTIFEFSHNSLSPNVNSLCVIEYYLSFLR